MLEKRPRFPTISSEKITIESTDDLNHETPSIFVNGEVSKLSDSVQERHVWEVKVEYLTQEEERSILRLSRFLYVHQGMEYECEISTAGITINTARLQSRRLASYQFRFIGRARLAKSSQRPDIHTAGDESQTLRVEQCQHACSQQL
jgi:hypothetical protein